MHKKLIVINCSTIYAGGALQVALSVINSFANKSDFIVYVIISKAISRQLSWSDDNVLIIEKSPARSLKTRKIIRNFVNDIQPNLVFTVFGPPYIKFNCLHLCGFAECWITKRKGVVVPGLSLLKRIRVFILTLYKLHYFNKADFWVVESESVKDAFLKRLNINAKKVHVVANEVSQYVKRASIGTPTRQVPKEFKVLFLSAYYLHKNFQILLPVIQHIAKTDLRCCFVTTLPEQAPFLIDLQKALQNVGLSHMLNNIGPVDQKDIPQLYNEHDILFFPTFLECFSATPLEALYMGCPMLISNIPENKAVAGEAAEYFDPYSVEDAVLKLANMMEHYNYFISDERMAVFDKMVKYYEDMPPRSASYRNIINRILSAAQGAEIE